MNVIRSQDSEGMVYLTCKAFGFFPRNISVVWYWDEEPMSRDAQESDGNGTYDIWVTIRIPQGEEPRVKCIVEHSGNHSAHLAPLGAAGSGATEEGLTSRGGRHLRLPLRFGLRPQGPCRVGTGESGLVL